MKKSVDDRARWRQSASYETEQTGSNWEQDAPRREPRDPLWTWQTILLAAIIASAWFGTLALILLYLFGAI